MLVRSIALIACLAMTAAALPSALRAQDTPAATAGAADEHVGTHAVVPPGKEDLLAEMLGRGEALPGECKFTGGQVDRTRVRGTYACGANEVVVELHHPGDAPAGAASTARFAVLVTSGQAPPGLVDALAERVRARESGFEWEWTHAAEPVRATQVNLVVVVACVLVIAVVGWVIRRAVRARRRASPS